MLLASQTHLEHHVINLAAVMLATLSGAEGEPPAEFRFKDLQVKKHFRLSGEGDSNQLMDGLHTSGLPPPAWFIVHVRSTDKEGAQRETVYWSDSKRGSYTTGGRLKQLVMEPGETVWLNEGKLETSAKATLGQKGNYSTSASTAFADFTEFAVIFTAVDERRGPKGTWSAEVHLLKQPLTNKTRVRLFN